MIKFEKIPENILSKVPDVVEILNREGNIVFAYLFGGLAEGKIKPLSDVDIAVYLKETINLAEYKLDLFNKLTSALGTSELDLVILNTAPVSLAGRILQNRQILIDKEPFKRHDYESLTLREYFDFRIKENTIFAARYGIGG